MRTLLIYDLFTICTLFHPMRSRLKLWNLSNATLLRFFLSGLKIIISDTSVLKLPLNWKETFLRPAKRQNL